MPRPTACALLWRLLPFHRKKTTGTPGLQTTFQRRGTNCLGSISGRITIDSAPGLRLMLLGTLQTADCEILTVDLHQVDYMDTSGLAVLLEVLRAARLLNKRFQLSGLGERPRYLLEMARLLPLFDEVDAEVSEVKGSRGDKLQ
jgi:anti-sigma B factor antagonist